jgi:hypothetical protein
MTSFFFHSLNTSLVYIAKQASERGHNKTGRKKRAPPSCIHHDQKESDHQEKQAYDEAASTLAIVRD